MGLAATLSKTSTVGSSHVSLQKRRAVSAAQHDALLPLAGQTLQTPHPPLSHHVTFQCSLVSLLSCQPTALAVITQKNTNPKQRPPPSFLLLALPPLPIKPSAKMLPSCWVRALPHSPTQAAVPPYPFAGRDDHDFVLFGFGKSTTPALFHSPPTGKKRFLPFSTRLRCCWRASVLYPDPRNSGTRYRILLQRL